MGTRHLICVWRVLIPICELLNTDEYNNYTVEEAAGLLEYVKATAAAN